jgi:hypothetical protein
MKAFVLSILTSLVFLSIIGLLSNSEKRDRPRYPPQTILADCPKVTKVKEPLDPNEKFRYVDGLFSHVDFKNRSYGQYRYSSGEKFDLIVRDGEFEYDFGPQEARGWFFLKDTFFTDVTGDGKPDAIVWFAHVECGVSCDGGRALFYVYSAAGDELKEIWRYETGAYSDGCGLKSLTIMNKQLVMQMFGRCSPPEKMTSEGVGKFMVSDTTILNFRFNGSRFVERSSEFLSAPTREVKNYNAEIHIVE